MRPVLRRLPIIALVLCTASSGCLRIAGCCVGSDDEPAKKSDQGVRFSAARDGCVLRAEFKRADGETMEGKGASVWDSDDVTGFASGDKVRVDVWANEGQFSSTPRCFGPPTCTIKFKGKEIGEMEQFKKTKSAICRAVIP